VVLSLTVSVSEPEEERLTGHDVPFFVSEQPLVCDRFHEMVTVSPLVTSGSDAVIVADGFSTVQLA